MVELLKEMASIGVSLDSAVLMVLVYYMDKRLTILETIFKGIQNGN